MGGVAVGTMALIVVLSVFNGLEELIRSIYGSFDPDLKIEAVEGKSFAVTDQWLDTINNAQGVAFITQVIEDNALLQYRDRQRVVRVKGVTPNFFRQNKIDSTITDGSHELMRHGGYRAVLGRGIQYDLGISVDHNFLPLQLLYPKVSKGFTLNPENAFVKLQILAGGVFAIERQYDDNYVFVPLQFAEQLFSYGNKRTAIEVKAAKGKPIAELQKELKKLLGPGFKVLNSDEQHVSLLRAVKVEKLFVFITFAFILTIASINIFFSLSMLVIDKKKDIAILSAMGATSATIRNIFLAEGALIAFSGAFIGLSLGFLICWVQQTFGLVSMGMQTAIVDSYPVLIKASDFVMTGITILVITVIVSIRPALNAAKLAKATEL